MAKFVNPYPPDHPGHHPYAAGYWRQAATNWQGYALAAGAVGFALGAWSVVLLPKLAALCAA